MRSKRKELILCASEALIQQQCNPLGKQVGLLPFMGIHELSKFVEGRRNEVDTALKYIKSFDLTGWALKEAVTEGGRTNWT
jgi:hypothetical protein